MPLPKQAEIVRAFDMMSLFLGETHTCLQAVRIACRPLAQTPEELRYHALFMRIVTWVQSSAKLSEPSDFQSVLGATRSVFESVIDLVLLYYGDADTDGLMQAWERSARYKHAECLCKYYETMGVSLPDEYKAHGIAMSSTRTKVLEDRKRYWKEKHPPRWTARSLDKDAQKAERLGGPLGLVAFYETKYRNFCFHLHGSSVAGADDIDALVAMALAGQAKNSICHLALQAADLLLSKLTPPEPEPLRAEVRRIRDNLPTTHL